MVFILTCAMTRDIDRNAQLELLAQVQERIRQVEADIIAENEAIAALERAGRDAREARALRARLWISQETNLAERDRLIEDMSTGAARRGANSTP